MNFFERQQVARRNTRVMLVLFLLAVVAIVIAVQALVILAWIMGTGDMGEPLVGQSTFGAAWASVPRGLHWLGFIVPVLAIATVSLWECANLRRGGGLSVAEMMGGRRIAGKTSDPLERRLVNVVEEMAIAAGTRVPAVYVMDDEKGVNAFAAGYGSADTVIAVTRGTLERLNRDELQAVVGHEFSHVVNGDMALSVRMIGVLAGIVFIGAVGQFILRSLRRGDGDGDGKGKGAFLLLGAGLVLIGSIGLFFARLIKAGVSRQREFLADAASVQFTRNPDGLAGALDQIRASTKGSLIASRHAEDVSHLFFGQGITVAMESLFATHPPIEERIRRISPRFQRVAYRDQRIDAKAGVVPAPEGAAGFAGDAPSSAQMLADGARQGDVAQQWSRSPAESVELVGALGAREADAARRILGGIPDSLRERLHDPQGAAASVVALLLAPVDSVMATQVEAARAAGAGALAEAAAACCAQIRALGPGYVLSVIDLALPALREAPEEDRKRVMGAVHAVIRADRRVSMWEFAVSTLLHAQLFPRPPATRARYRSLEEVRPDVVFAMSLLANAGAGGDPNAAASAETAFRAGASAIGWHDARPLAREDIGMQEAEKVLERLALVAPMPKALLVKALFATVTSDGSIRVVEAAMMRMVGGVLDCPLPPLLESVDPHSLAA